LSAPWISPSITQASILGSLFLTTLGLALAGGAHCALMCGGLARACGGDRPRGQIAWQLGRLVSYLTLGTGASLFGSELIHQFKDPNWAWLIPALLLSGLLGFVLFNSERRASIGFFGHFARAVGRTPWILGFLTGSLPCGWLWSFGLLAATGGSIPWAWTVMFALWLGSLPALLAAPQVMNWILRPLGRLISQPRRWVIAFSLVLGMSNLFMHYRHWGAPSSQGIDHSAIDTENGSKKEPFSPMICTHD
jgi:sulfite exporter TauE/SafE